MHYLTKYDLNNIKNTKIKKNTQTPKMFKFYNKTRLFTSNTKQILPKTNTAEWRMANIQNFDQLKAFYVDQKSHIK